MIVHRSFDEVFRSWSNVAVLRALIDTASGFSGREVARVAGMSIRSALQALTLLESMSIVNRQRGGRDHIFTLNRNHYLMEHAIVPMFSAEQQFPKEIQAALANALKGRALSVVLFGSVARGEETVQSDLDLCCIVDNASRREKVESKLDDLSPELHNRFGVTVGPIFFTLTEFRKKAKQQNPLIRQILETGIVLTGKNPKYLLHG